MFGRLWVVADVCPHIHTQPVDDPRKRPVKGGETTYEKVVREVYGSAASLYREAFGRRAPAVPRASRNHAWEARRL